MKNLVKVNLITVALVMMSSMLLAQTVTVTPNQAPKGAYVNGSDGDHQWIQVIKYTVGTTWSGFGSATDIVITLPDSMTIADTDGDGDLNDEVTVREDGVATAGTKAVTSTQIVMNISAGNASGDIIWWIIPVTTASGASGSQNWTIALATGQGETTTSFTPSVTYTDTLTVATFDPVYVGNNDATPTTEGLIFPAVANNVVTVTGALLLEDGAGTAELDNTPAGIAWYGTAVNATDNDGEVTTTLWASQTQNLTRVNSTNAHQPITTTVTVATGDDGAKTVGATGATVPTYLFDATLLDENFWYFYITSSASGDWAIATSDSINIQHWPTFDATNTNSGGGFDFDVDGVYTDGASGDNVATLTLESGGTLGKDGLLVSGGNNLDNIDIFWVYNDVDDDASLEIFRSTDDALTITDLVISGTEPNETVDSIGTNSVKITSSSISEASSTTKFNYDIFTDVNTFETAGTFFIYLVVNDGKNQNVHQVQRTAGAGSTTLFVKHFPFFRFDDIYPTNPGVVDSGTDDFYVISWGSDINGDLDADDNATITFYYSLTDLATTLGADGTDVIDPAADEATNFVANNILITTTTEDPDGLADNRFMWKFSDISPALTAATNHFIIAHIQGGTDELLVQYAVPLGPDATPDTDRPFQPAHSEYFRAETPLEGETLILDGQDEFEFRWTGFDRDDAAGDLVQMFIVPAGADVAAILSANTWAGLDADATGDLAAVADWYFINGINGGSESPTATGGATIADGKFTLDVSDLTTDMDGTTVNPSGFYDFWYVTTYTGTFTTEVPRQGPGVLRFTGSTAATTSFSLVPNVAYLSIGDTVTVTVLARSAGALNVDLMTVEIDVPGTFFSVVDQGSGAPFINENVNFIGTQLVNKQSTSGGVISLSYAERDASPSEDLNAADLDVLSFQIVADSAASGTELLDQLIEFVSSGTRVTGIVDANGNQEVLTLASPAATFQAAPPGGLKGEVALEILDDEGETVDFWVTPLGSFTPITDADYLAANGGANSDGSVTVTLGVDGAYTLSSIPTGDYDVKVHKDFHLDQLSSNVEIRPTLAQTLDFNGSDLLLAGDISGYDDDGDTSTDQVPDNQIDAADVTAVSNAFGSSTGDPNFFAPADLDGDGTVYILDYNTIVANLNTNGEGPVYKVRSGENESVVNLLAISRNGDEYSFAIELSNLTSLHAYAAEMNINPQHWELVSFSDGMGSFGRTEALQMASGYDWTFASAVVGRGGDIRSKTISMMSVTLRARVGDPEPIFIEEVTLVAGNGSVSMALVADRSRGIPSEYVLSQNYPNPFNPSTTINFSLPESGQVKLAVYNLLGQEVRQLVSGDLSAGNYRAIWSGMDNTGRKVSSGLYFYRLVVDNRVVDTRKMAFLK